jgi:hypothetical protein
MKYFVSMVSKNYFRSSTQLNNCVGKMQNTATNLLLCLHFHTNKWLCFESGFATKWESLLSPYGGMVIRLCSSSLACLSPLIKAILHEWSIHKKQGADDCSQTKTSKTYSHLWIDDQSYLLLSSRWTPVTLWNQFACVRWLLYLCIFYQINVCLVPPSLQTSFKDMMWCVCAQECEYYYVWKSMKLVQIHM